MDSVGDMFPNQMTRCLVIVHGGVTLTHLVWHHYREDNAAITNVDVSFAVVYSVISICIINM